MAKTKKIKPADLLAKLSREGCCVHVSTMGMHAWMVGMAWIRRRTLYWVAIPCEDQHHVHGHSIKSVKTHHERDVEVFLRDGQTLYFAPWVEWGGYGVDRVTFFEEREKAAKYIATEEGRANVREFLMGAIGDAPDDLQAVVMQVQ